RPGPRTRRTAAPSSTPASPRARPAAHAAAPNPNTYPKTWLNLLARPRGDLLGERRAATRARAAATRRLLRRRRHDIGRPGAAPNPAAAPATYLPGAGSAVAATSGRGSSTKPSRLGMRM